MPEPYYVCKLKDNDNKHTNFLTLILSQSSDKIREWNLFGSDEKGLIYTKEPTATGTGLRINGNKANELYANGETYATLTFPKPIPFLKYGESGSYVTRQKLYMSAQFIGYGTIVNGMFVSEAKSVSL